MHVIFVACVRDALVAVSLIVQCDRDRSNPGPSWRSARVWRARRRGSWFAPRRRARHRGGARPDRRDVRRDRSCANPDRCARWVSRRALPGAHTASTTQRLFSGVERHAMQTITAIAAPNHHQSRVRPTAMGFNCESPPRRVQSPRPRAPTTAEVTTRSGPAYAAGISDRLRALVCCKPVLDGPRARARERVACGVTAVRS